MNNSIQTLSLKAEYPLPANLCGAIDSNPCPLTATATSKARNLITELNQTAGGNLTIKVNGLEVTAELNFLGRVDKTLSQTVTPATLQRAFCAFMSEVFTTLY